MVNASNTCSVCPSRLWENDKAFKFSRFEDQISEEELVYNYIYFKARPREKKTQSFAGTVIKKYLEFLHDKLTNHSKRKRSHISSKKKGQKRNRSLF